MGYAKATPLRREPGVSIAFPVRSVEVQQGRGCTSVALKKGGYLRGRQSADDQSTLAGSRHTLHRSNKNGREVQIPAGERWFQYPSTPTRSVQG